MTNHFCGNYLQKYSLALDRHIGSGKYVVYHGRSLTNGNEYAVKLFPTRTLDSYRSQREKRFLQLVDHPNVIKFVSEVTLQDHNMIYTGLIIEYAPYGDLFDLVAMNRFIDESMIRQYFKQLLSGLGHLHSKKISHGDIKLENLFIGQNYKLKIGDFDQASMSTEKALSGGTSGYRAPEVIRNECVDAFASDIYAAGIVLYVMVVGEMPFCEEEVKGKIKVRGQKYFWENNKAFWDLKARQKQNKILFNEDFRVLVNGMLAEDPIERFTLEQVITSAWCQGPVCKDEDFVMKMKQILQIKLQT
jgi:serine/threonine protein kinase